MEELTVIFTSPEGNSSQHTIYCKRHWLRQPSANIPNGRTLFTTSWPPYCGKEEIKEIFTRVGQVEEVHIQEEGENGPLTGRFTVCYIVFQEEEEVTRALSLCSGVPLSCSLERVGLKKWCVDYRERYPSESILEKEAREGVNAYDEWLEKEMKRKKRLSEPDEEGWITVTAKTPRNIERRIKKKKRRKNKKELSLKLYNFQQRESQREKIAELRKKFQEDKEMVAAMKAKRKFQPF